MLNSTDHEIYPFYKQVGDLTENRDILNKCTISLLVEYVVLLSTNIEISQVRPVPISPNHLFQTKCRKWNRWLSGVYQKRRFASESLCFFAFLRLQMWCKF